MVAKRRRAREMPEGSTLYATSRNTVCSPLRTDLARSFPRTRARALNHDAVESSSSSTIAAAIERQSGRRIHLFGKLGLRLNGFPACDGSDLGSIARSTHAR